MRAMAESRRMVKAGMGHRTNSPGSTGSKGLGLVEKAEVSVTDRTKV